MLEDHRGPLGYSPLAAFYTDTRLSPQPTPAASPAPLPVAPVPAAVSRPPVPRATHPPEHLAWRYTDAPVSVYSTDSIRSFYTDAAEVAYYAIQAEPEQPAPQHKQERYAEEYATPTASSRGHASSDTTDAHAHTHSWPGAELLDMLRAADMRARLAMYTGYERGVTWVEGSE